MAFIYVPFGFFFLFYSTVDQDRHHQGHLQAHLAISFFHIGVSSCFPTKASLACVLDSNQRVVCLDETLGKICDRARDTKVQ